MKKNNFNDKLVGEGITFDDVLLVPQKSSVLPSEVTLTTKFTRNITLNLPVVSAAMDTVTESKMAIAMARQGGIGVIHKNLSIADQAKEVDKVKRNELGFINNPIVLSKDETIAHANELLALYKISGLPVVDQQGKLEGIITNRDIKYAKSEAQKVASVMTKNNLITSLPGISLDEAKEIMLVHRIEKLPIVDKKNFLLGMYTIKDINNKEHYPNACKDNEGRLRCAAAVGVSDDTLERVQALVAVGVDAIVIDSAHGHSQSILSMIKIIRHNFPKLDLIAGNIVTKAAAQELITLGVDAVKVGVGPGSICTTRVVAGVGVPQITAISDVYEVCAEQNIPVIADGGIKYSGDIVKALGAGASCVMMGGVLAGATEAPGEEIIIDGRKYKSYVGMGSLAAMKRGSSDRYFQGQQKKFVPEGVEAMVPFKGEINEVLFQFTGGIRAGMGYCGTKNILELNEHAKFIKISNSALVESHPHGVLLTKEPPNYNKQ